MATTRKATTEPTAEHVRDSGPAIKYSEREKFLESATKIAERRRELLARLAKPRSTDELGGVSAS